MASFLLPPDDVPEAVPEPDDPPAVLEPVLPPFLIFKSLDAAAAAEADKTAVSGPPRALAPPHDGVDAAGGTDEGKTVSPEEGLQLTAAGTATPLRGAVGTSVSVSLVEVISWPSLPAPLPCCT